MRRLGFAAAVFLSVVTTGVPVVAGELFTHAPLTLLRGPGAEFPNVAVLAKGTPISVLWCNADADWCLVDAEQGQGWVPIATLRATKSGAATNGAATAAASAGADAGPAAAGASATAESSGVGASVAIGNGGVSVSVSTPASSVQLTTK